MGYTKIWIHLVWAVKRRQPLLTGSIREVVFEHIRENAKTKNIYVDSVNGYVDHIHLLISLNASDSVSKVVQLIKGESSYWINKHKLTPEKFEWQDDYFAVSVTPSEINTVRNYIKNQEEHHRKRTFAEEYEEFIEQYGFSLVRG